MPGLPFFSASPVLYSQSFPAAFARLEAGRTLRKQLNNMPDLPFFLLLLSFTLSLFLQRLQDSKLEERFKKTVKHA